MRIQHNLSAMNSLSNYAGNNSKLSGNLEKLSSGYAINSAADNAAGLAISEKMRSQIAGLEKAQDNANDGISLVQTAEGALTEVNSMLTRLTELATQSANGTYQDDVDRDNLQEEANALLDEMDRISQSTNFNGINLLDGSMSSSKTQPTQISLENMSVGDNLSFGGKTYTFTDATTAAENYDIVEASITKDPDTYKEVSSYDGVGYAFGEAATTAVNATMSITGGSNKVSSYAGYTETTDYTSDTGLTWTPPTAGAAPVDATLDSTKTSIAGGGTPNISGVASATGTYTYRTVADGGNEVTAVSSAGSPGFAAGDVSFAKTVKADTYTYKDQAYNATTTDLALAGTPTFTADEEGSYTIVNHEIFDTNGTKVTDTTFLGKFNNVASATDGSFTITAAGWHGAAAGNTGVNSDITLAAGKTKQNGDTITVKEVKVSEDGWYNDADKKILSGATVTVDGTGAATGDKINVKTVGTPAGTSTSGSWTVPEGKYFAEDADGNKVEITSENVEEYFSAAHDGSATVKSQDTKIYKYDGTAGAAGSATISGAVTSGTGNYTYRTTDDVNRDIAFEGGITGATVNSNLAAGEYTYDLAKTKWFDSDGNDVSASITGAAGSLADGDKITVTDHQVTEDGWYNDNGEILSGATITATAGSFKAGDKVNITAAGTAASDGTAGAWTVPEGTFYGENAAGEMEEITAENAGNYFAASADGTITTVSADVKIFGVDVEGETHETLASKTLKSSGTTNNFSSVDELKDLLNRDGFTAEVGTKTVADQSFDTVDITSKALTLQVGDTNTSFQHVAVDVADMSASGLGLRNSVDESGHTYLNINDQESAGKAIETIKNAVNQVSAQRGKLGATQNRLEHTLNNLDATNQNITASESQIRDTDMAKEMTEYSKNNILVQAAQSMLAQANSMPQGVLQLLG